MRCALNARGCARSSSHTDGAILTFARNDKERKYHELLASDRCHLIVVAMEKMELRVSGVHHQFGQRESSGGTSAVAGFRFSRFAATMVFPRLWCSLGLRGPKARTATRQIWRICSAQCEAAARRDF